MLTIGNTVLFSEFLVAPSVYVESLVAAFIQGGFAPLTPPHLAASCLPWLPCKIALDSRLMTIFTIFNSVKCHGALSRAMC